MGKLDLNETLQTALRSSRISVIQSRIQLRPDGYFKRLPHRTDNS
jgi:hypothetical protein